MSRIGKKPVDIPSGVHIDINDSVIKVKGPKGELSWLFPEGVKIAADSGEITVERSSDKKTDRALHGLARSMVSNMVTGVSQGYKKVLEMRGIGYKGQLKGNRLVFSLGYSHQIEYDLPQGVIAATDEKQTAITLSGVDKQLLGQVAANLRKLRSPDAYKGKGVRYSGERIKLKAGKTGKK
jgi:large subunit ribosomal protein L6